jgi:hypothetical protein
LIAATVARSLVRANQAFLAAVAITCVVPGVLLFGTLMFEDNFAPLGVWRGPGPLGLVYSPAFVASFGFLIAASPYLTTAAVVLGLALLSSGATSRSQGVALAILLAVAWVGTAHVTGTAHSCWGVTPFRFFRSVW